MKHQGRFGQPRSENMFQTENPMASDQLSFNTRKSLCNHLGELAGAELAAFLQQLKNRIESVERDKVAVTRIVPDSPARAPSAIPSGF